MTMTDSSAIAEYEKNAAIQMDMLMLYFPDLDIIGFRLRWRALLFCPFLKQTFSEQELTDDFCDCGISLYIKVGSPDVVERLPKVF